MTKQRLILGFLFALAGIFPAAAQDSFGEQVRPTQPVQAAPQNAPLQEPQDAGQPADPLDALMQMEREDFGVPPTTRLHSGAMHGPTPASIPGGQVITTKGLLALLQSRQAPVLLLDILGGPETIPGAQYAAPASQPGDFHDLTQQQFGQYLEQATGGARDYPLVLFCQSPHCWMSYNAALRAINLGYTNVLWYRGGIEAWRQAGQRLVSVQQRP